MPLTKADIRKAPYDGAAIIGYNRLEGVPNSPDYRKSLGAEIHDALWMLTRQWQMGEFNAEDAGTLVKTRLLVEQQKMTHMDVGNQNVFPLNNPYAMPIEMIVEKEGRTADLAFRIEIGKLFKDILIENHLMPQLIDFLALFKIQLLELVGPNSPEEKLVTNIRANRSDSQIFDALKNRVLDGFAIFQALTKLGNVYDSLVENSFAGAGAEVIMNAKKAGQDFLAQLDLFYGTDMQKDNPAWRPEHLDYRFNIQTDEDPASSTIMEVARYAGGRLDWFDFDIKQISGTPEVTAHDFIPSPVIYPGMPKSRWWEMEENEINFGNINVKTTDLPTLILIDFALIYGNDWLIIPFPMELNSLCSIKGFLVKDVFGFHTYIPPVDIGSGSSWEKWSLFNHTGTDSSGQPLLYLAPTLLKPIEQEPLERVSFLRDETSNMAWAFENVIQGAFGKGLRGAEAAEKPDDNEDIPPSQDQPLKYQLGKEVPFYQIPFIPVEIPLDTTHSQIRLQRAKLPQGQPPRGVFLTEVPSPYYIREENISKAGTTVIRRWQRARWLNGTIAQWIGREKQAGKSEGNASLLFDTLTYGSSE